ncbi:MAG: hypothetical protein LBP42_02245 [Treponema sp.]|jgi:hypothetical protein|nr:hypothetical protein [Treponema sp.]
MLVLKENERRLVEEIEAYLEKVYPEDAQVVKDRFLCLQGLGNAVSRYPSVRETQLLRGESRNDSDLVASLCSFASSSHLLHIPTRVVTARSVLVAKFHAFSLLSLLMQDVNEFHAPLRSIIFSIISTLMAEEVYFSCLGDPGFPQNIKIKLANDLISLWDNGTDLRVVRHLSALESLWTARDTAPPSFGTMDGASELLRISIDMEEDWRDFLMEESANNETKWALEEFLFGLSYEEITKIRSRLIRFGVSAVGYDEVRSYLGSRPSYGMVKSADPRAVYDFYVDRREAALFRKRTAAPGPRRTLEDIYLKYRIFLESE